MRIFLFFFIVLSYLSNAQNFSNQVLSPEASVFNRINTNNDINYFTGSPIINIPIESLDVDGYTVKVALNYNGSGVKVSDQSSSVGLGWSLYTGGMITRKVRDYNDDLNYPVGTSESIFLENGYGYINNYVEDFNVKHTDIYNWLNSTNEGVASLSNSLYPIYRITDYSLGQKRIDTEPDVFEFNFNGKSGKFFFDNDNGDISIHQVPWLGLKIEYEIGADEVGRPGIISFIITDTDNTKYFFEDTETFLSNYWTSHVGLTYIPEIERNVWGPKSGTNVDRYFNTWKLSKVITSRGKVITYEYEDEEIFSKPIGMQAFSKHLLYNTPNDSLIQKVNYTGISLFTKRISKIKAPTFNIEFIKEEERGCDNRSSLIKEIKVNKNTIIGGVTKKFKLYYGESISEGISIADIDTQCNYKRTILQEIRQYSLTNDDYESFKFDYNLANFGGTSDQKLPHNNSSSIDLWGYYNGAQNKYFVPKTYVYPDLSNSAERNIRYEKLENYSGREYIFDGADRAPNSTYMGIGSLKSIKFPTGGLVTYEFEPNTYIDEGRTFLGPGLRVKKIISNDGSNSNIQKFIYNDKNNLSTGKLVARPIMANLEFRYYPEESTYRHYENNLVRYSSFQSEMTNIDSRIIGYEKVTKITPNKGKTIYKFSNIGTIEDINDISYYDDEEYGRCLETSPDGYCDGLFIRPTIHNIYYGNTKNFISQIEYNQNYKTNSPHPPAPNYEWNRGHLMFEEHYNEQGEKIQKTNYIYENFYPHNTAIYKYPYYIFGLKIKEQNLVNPNIYDTSHALLGGTVIKVSKYKIITDIAKVLSKKIDSTYFPNTDSKPIVTKTSYFRENIGHTFVTKESTNNSKGDIISVEYKYPPDLLSTLNFSQNILMRKLTSLNKISEPVIIRKKFNDNIVEEKKIMYDNFSGVNNQELILPKTILFKKGENSQNPIDRIISLDKYDNYGNLLEYTTKEGLSVSQIWGYNNTKVVAELKNLRYDEISATTISNIKAQTGYMVLVGTPSLESSFTSLRTNHPDAFVTTYTYIPMVGLKTMTDINGRKETYEYDSFNRLYRVLDYEGNVLKEYNYNIKN